MSLRRKTDNCKFKLNQIIRSLRWICGDVVHIIELGVMSLAYPPIVLLIIGLALIIFLPAVALKTLLCVAVMVAAYWLHHWHESHAIPPNPKGREPQPEPASRSFLRVVSSNNDRVSSKKKLDPPPL